MDLLKYQDGALLLIDKPVNWTSFDVVAKLRNTLRIKKIGHAGTLDPLATGLLIIGTGKFTKKLDEYQGLDKTYEGVFEIGKTTPSYDLETEFDSSNDYSAITNSDIEQAVKRMTGTIQQFPPVFSAIKVDGERAYKKARKKETFELKSREVVIHSFDMSIQQLPEVNFKICCSKGTYIRSIAHDLGKALGVGAYLKELKRTHIGEFSVEDARQLSEFVEEYKIACK